MQRTVGSRSVHFARLKKDRTPLRHGKIRQILQSNTIFPSERHGAEEKHADGGNRMRVSNHSQICLLFSRSFLRVVARSRRHHCIFEFDSETRHNANVSLFYPLTLARHGICVCSGFQKHSQALRLPSALYLQGFQSEHRDC